MAGKTPLIDYTGGDSIKEWTKTLDDALKLDFDTVILNRSIAGRAVSTRHVGIYNFVSRRASTNRPPAEQPADEGVGRGRSTVAQGMSLAGLVFPCAIGILVS